MLTRLLASAALVAVVAAPALAQETVFPATLVGHAILPANTLIAPPADAPASLAIAGKYTGADRSRVAEPGTVPGMDGLRPTGLALPFEGQPVQGFSGIAAVGDGTYWTLSDNGFGNKLNSVDTMLMLHHLGFDWDAGTVDRMATIFLSDPNFVVPFPIVNEASAERYLTGGDFDPESIQPVADGFWIGEEFGPYLVKVDLEGVVTAVIPTTVGETVVRSPDHPAINLPANPTAALPAFNLKRSGGYEGLALSTDGAHLYALLEGPLYVDGAVEMVGDAPALRIVELDVETQEWTGRSWLYPFSAGGAAIGDFNMIDENRALVIERDNGAGGAAGACAQGAPAAADCFASPAVFKRVYIISFGDENVGEAVAKLGYIDLMNIADPNNIRRAGGGEGFYDMPFVTIENVEIVDETHIIVGNDNNLPFSAGRSVNAVDDNEFVLLEVGEFLAAR
ncbi:MAG: esterase-like activity of phytase family protein [Bauldia sp.]|nr:esterase-like activity of phytase family protein [Bauldia sp.]